MKCRHCQCEIPKVAKCSVCGCVVGDQCDACHKELAHDVIQNQNIHIVGSGSGHSIADDPDAYGRASDSR